MPGVQQQSIKPPQAAALAAQHSFVLNSDNQDVHCSREIAWHLDVVCGAYAGPLWSAADRLYLQSGLLPPLVIVHP